MFNSHIYQSGPRHVDIESKTTVHEHRAPTDQSMALLRELERKAEETLLHAIRLDRGNELRFRAIIRQGLFHEELRVQFNLNDESIDFTITLPLRRSVARTNKDYIVAIRDGVAKEIANRILIHDPEFLK